MVDIFKNDLTTRLLAKSLDGLSMRGQAISNNVANIDTPKFKSTEVTFEDDLRAAITRDPVVLPMFATDARHLGGARPLSVASVNPKATPMLSTSIRADGNNVDMDREMARLAETQIAFQASTQVLNHKYQQYKLAIFEGRK